MPPGFPCESRFNPRRECIIRLQPTCSVKEFLTNLLLKLATIQVESGEEQISLCSKDSTTSLCSMSHLLCPFTASTKAICSRAQRLSASLESSRRVRRVGRKSATSAQRLSASLESSLSGITQNLLACISAQRLSASLESSPCTSCAASRAHSRAQRLSASLESSPAVLGPTTGQKIVLNAFRHHWNLHP